MRALLRWTLGSVMVAAGSAGVVVALGSGAGCAPVACSDEADRQGLQDVELLMTADGLIAEAAQARLIARGRDSIALLETGLYAAEPPARLRIIRALAAIGSLEAVPVLAHLARRDPNPEVQAAAAAAQGRLTHP